jgi:hypothetical protein
MSRKRRSGGKSGSKGAHGAPTYAQRMSQAMAPLQREAPAARRPAWYAPLLAWFQRLPHPVDAFVTTRLLLLIACAVGMWLWPTFPDPPAFPLRPSADHPYIAFPSMPWLDGWVRWDSAWYQDIASKGYWYQGGQQSNVAFFPLYPLIVSAVAIVPSLFLPFDQAFYLAALLVAHGAFLLALVGMSRLAHHLLAPDAARRAVWLLCLFPFGFFYAAAYTESLFLALAVWSLWAGLRGRWGLACACAALCGLTRSVGAFVAVALFVEYLHQRRYSWRRLDLSVLWFLVTPLGVLAYFGFLWWKFGDPLLAARAQEAWGHSFAPPPFAEMWRLLAGDWVLPYIRFLMGVYLITMVAAPVLSLIAWRRYGPGLGIFALTAALLPMAGGIWAGYGRYCSVLFPAFLVLGEMTRRRWVYVLLLIIWIPIQIVFVYKYSHWMRPL